MVRPNLLGNRHHIRPIIRPNLQLHIRLQPLAILQVSNHLWVWNLLYRWSHLCRWNQVLAKNQRSRPSPLPHLPTFLQTSLRAPPSESPSAAPSEAPVGGTVVADVSLLDLSLIGIRNFNGVANRETWETLTETYIQQFYACGDFGAVDLTTDIEISQVNGNAVSDTVNRVLQQTSTEAQYTQSLTYTLTDATVTPELVAILPFCSPIDRELYVQFLQDSGNSRLENVVDTSRVSHVGGLPACPGTIVELARAVPQLSILAGLLGEYPIIENLINAPGSFTVFAPSNEAFERLESALGVPLSSVPKDTISTILAYHVYPERFVSGKLDNGVLVSSNGLGARIINDGSSITVNRESLVLKADVLASNGVVHVVDDVLLPPNLDLLDTAASFQIFQTLLATLDATNLDDALRGDGPFTLFAPTDAAFAKLGNDAIINLLNNPDILRDILLYHVSPGVLGSGDLAGINEIPTLLDDRVVNASPDGRVLNGAVTFEFTDSLATNGVFHAIDRVLNPNGVPGAPDILDFISRNPSLSTLESLLEDQFDLKDLLTSEGPLTLFAPSNEAFQKLSAAIGLPLAELPADVVLELVSYHVYSPQLLESELESGIITNLDGLPTLIDVSDGIVINGETEVIAADNLASNGVVHIIDDVLIPPAFDLIESATTFNIFRTLLFSLDATDLDDVLREDGPFTLFAPTDDAFAKLGQDTINALFANIDEFRDILLYHVVPGFLSSADLEGIGQIATAAEGTVITATSSGEFLNGNVGFEFTDALTTNGVIHAIDTVLDPRSTPGFDVVGTAQRFSIFETLLFALDATDLDSVLQGPGPFTVFAPTDEAFAALGQDVIDELVADLPRLTNILLYHVASGLVGSGDFAESGEIPTLLPGSFIDVSDDGTKLNTDVTFLFTDAISTNGVVHAINSVLDPADSVEPPAVAPAIPTNSPIAGPPAPTVPTEAPIPAPVLPPSQRPPTVNFPPVAGGGSIAEIVSSVPELSTLLSLLQIQPGLVQLLDGPGTFTVFAPTNQAFNNIEDVFGIRIEDTGLATQGFILQYHLYEEVLFSAGLVSGGFIRSSNGNATLVERFDDGFIRLPTAGNPNPSNVILADITASNGVVHIVDNVLLAPSLSIPEMVSNDPDLSILLSALSVSGLDVAPSEEGPFTVFGPTNQAFLDLGQQTLDFVTDPANVNVLTRILLYHASPDGFIGSGDLFQIGPGTVSTLIERTITVNSDGTLLNGNVGFVATNMVATNGVIHKINTVLNPDP